MASSAVGVPGSAPGDPTRARWAAGRGRSGHPDAVDDAGSQENSDAAEDLRDEQAHLGGPRGGIGALSRVLLEESERGDHVAREIETLMIDHAVAFAVAAQRRAPSRRRRIPIVLIGSTILAPLPGYRSRLVDAFNAAIPNGELRPLREPPALGALLYALDESGAGPAARARAETSLRAAIKKAKPVKI